MQVLRCHPEVAGAHGGHTGTVVRMHVLRVVAQGVAVCIERARPAAHGPQRAGELRLQRIGEARQQNQLFDHSQRLLVTAFRHQNGTAKYAEARSNGKSTLVLSIFFRQFFSA